MEIKTHKLVEIVVQAMSDMDTNSQGTWEHGYGQGILTGLAEMCKLLGEKTLMDDVFKTSEKIKLRILHDKTRADMRNEESMRPQLKIKNGGKQ